MAGFCHMAAQMMAHKEDKKGHASVDRNKTTET